MTELQSLFIDVVNKDQQAFQTLYNNTSAKLYSLCLHLLNNDKETAEEVLQETYIKIWNKADKYNSNKGSPMSWMITVARNQAFDRMRSYKYRPNLCPELSYESNEYASNELGYIEQKGQKEIIAFFQEQLEKLPIIQQQAITKSLAYGYTHTEISKQLEVPLGTVKSWLRRSVPVLKTEMSEYMKTIH